MYIFAKSSDTMLKSLISRYSIMFRWIPYLPTIAFSIKDNAGDAHCLGWSLEALRFLVEERNVAAIGRETLDTNSSAILP